jgi:hypothetical protein
MLGVESPADGEPSMSEITTIGLDLAKHVFQVHRSVLSKRYGLPWPHGVGGRKPKK